MIEIIELKAPPPGLDVQKEKTTQWWSVGYGSFNDLTNHTPLLQLGAVPISFLGKRAYLWAVVTEEGKNAGRATLREARRVAESFFQSSPWEFVAFCETELEVNARFLRWLGFRHVSTVEGLHYFLRPK